MVCNNRVWLVTGRYMRNGEVSSFKSIVANGWSRKDWGAMLEWGKGLIFRFRQWEKKLVCVKPNLEFSWIFSESKKSVLSLFEIRNSNVGVGHTSQLSALNIGLNEGLNTSSTGHFVNGRNYSCEIHEQFQVNQTGIFQWIHYFSIFFVQL